MKKTMQRAVLALSLTALLGTAALAASAPADSATPADPAAISAASSESRLCYPTSVTCSEDGTEIRKAYDLSPEEDPTGIPRSDFEQDGFHYTLSDLLKQELPEYEERTHTETVTLDSPDKDMGSVLALLPQEKEFITEDGLKGTLSLQLETVKVEAAGYGSTTKRVTATRSYPNLSGQDTQYVPKSIEEDGRTLTLESIDWQTDNTTNVDGYAMGDRFTAVATYTGSATSSYVKGYTVTADYTGTVSRIILNKTRYVAVFKGEPLEQPEQEQPPAENPESELESTHSSFPWRVVLIPLGVVALAGAGIGAGIVLRRRREQDDVEDDTEDAEYEEAEDDEEEEDDT